MIDNFAVFILSHGRADRVKTYDTLRRQGYTGDIYIIIDNEDKMADEYKRRFGDKVIVFNKDDIARRVDTGDNFPDRKIVVFARNACFEIAKTLGIEYFLQLDDDYRCFKFRFAASLRYKPNPIKHNLDKVFLAMLRYYKSIPAATIAFAQGGDFIGGGNNGTISDGIATKRKAMNTFFCSTNRPFKFFGRVNEDTNAYVNLGNRGELMFTVFNISIDQTDTQSAPGGLTETYIDRGTYQKSFYTVMYAPSCVKISTMSGNKKRKGRIHHFVEWDKAVPCIISEDFRKRSQKPELVNTPELIG